MEYQEYGFDQQRLGCRQAWIDQSLEPYPNAAPGGQGIEALVAAALAREGAGQPLAESVRTSGRVWGRRAMGRSLFADLRQGEGRIQLYFSRGDFEPEAWDRLDGLALGDLIGVEGELFRTRTGELSIRVTAWRLEAKALVPVPVGKESGDQVYYRGSDTEMRYRQRYLHWLLEPQARQRIRRRAQIVAGIRQYLGDADFLEVDTPTIAPMAGGALARPFATSIRALDHQQAFLRIAPELHLKQYLVGGFERVFTVCQNFRNEGIDRSHNPEFTMVEWYEIHTDYRRQMQRFEELVAGICQAVCGSTEVEYQRQRLDFAPPWPRLTVLDALARYGGVEVGDWDAAQVRAELTRRGLPCQADWSWGEAVGELFEALCVDLLQQPVFIVDYPLDLSPLARRHPTDGRLVERFEVYVAGMELGNAYSELNDPVEQLGRLAQQRKDGDELPAADAEFIRALGCGMPPAGGVGLGVDRLVMLLTDAVSIRDVVAFPVVKPLRG
ncbi:MAG: lysine--tRNA ligase [Candidatus Latescibacteria bacterium]|nr:lysine--tRNA ligase [Candidatus Latescibacterota bacterium]